MTLPNPAPEDLSIPPAGLAPHTMRMEQFNKAYVHAIASAAGYTTAKPEIDDDSIDIFIRSRAKHGPRKAPQIDAQLKATADFNIVGNEFKFDLSPKNYDDLRDDDVITPRILIVMLVPRDALEWVTCDDDGITLQKRAYWLSLKGLKPKSNTTSIRVSLPTTNVFNISSLHELMNKAGRQLL